MLFDLSQRTALSRYHGSSVTFGRTLVDAAFAAAKMETGRFAAGSDITALQ
jgi:hypothetical protein